MNDDAVRVRQQQAAAQLTVERNVGAGDHAPVPVPQYGAYPWEQPQNSPGGPVKLI
jgi:hypothetical protein